MADDDGARMAAVPGSPADEGTPDLLRWTCSLTSVQRITADPDDDIEDDVFAVAFQVDGPNASAEVEILVTDHEDEIEIVAIALDMLHRAMKAWGRMTEDRRIAARDLIA